MERRQLVLYRSAEGGVEQGGTVLRLRTRREGTHSRAQYTLPLRSYGYSFSKIYRPAVASFLRPAVCARAWLCYYSRRVSVSSTLPASTLNAVV